MSLHLTDLTVARNKNVICCNNLNLISLCNFFRLQYGFRKYLHAIFAAPNFPILSYHHYALRVLPSCENFSYIFPKREESRPCNLGNEYASYYLRSVLEKIEYKSPFLKRNELSEIYVSILTVQSEWSHINECIQWMCFTDFFCNKDNGWINLESVFLNIRTMSLPWQ